MVDAFEKSKDGHTRVRWPTNRAGGCREGGASGGYLSYSQQGKEKKGKSARSSV